MKNIILVLVLILSTYILYSCGGVIGNIQKYSFSNVSATELKAALNRVYIKYPELVKSNDKMYGKNNEEDFYYLLDNNGQKIVFQCNVIVYSPPYEKEIDLSLTTAATWGKVMQLAPEMGFFEKRKYRKLFEENILPKVKEELKHH